MRRRLGSYFEVTHCKKRSAKKERPHRRTQPAKRLSVGSGYNPILYTLLQSRASLKERKGIYLVKTVTHGKKWYLNKPPSHRKFRLGVQFLRLEVSGIMPLSPLLWWKVRSKFTVMQNGHNGAPPGYFLRYECGSRVLGPLLSWSTCQLDLGNSSVT